MNNGTFSPDIGNVSVGNIETGQQDISVSGVMSAVYIIISVIGILGNLFSLVVYLSSKTLRRKLTNWYLMNQSIIDLLVSFFLLLMTVTVTDVNVGSGIAAELHCRLWKTDVWQWSLMISSTYNLVMLTLERYTEIIHPIWHKIHVGRRQVIMSLILAWLIGFVYIVTSYTSTSKVDDGSCVIYYFPNDIARKTFGFVTIIVQFLIPFLILAYCYTKIALVLHKRVVKVDVATINTSNATSTSSSIKWHQARKNTVKTLALVAFSYISCWSWNQVYYLMFNLGYPADFSSNFFHFTVIILFSNAIANPFIYTFQYSNFKSAAKQLFCKTNLLHPETSGSSI